MKNFTQTILILLFCLSCSKNLQNVKSSENSIVDALNQDKYDEALALTEKELSLDPDNLELQYLKVQAISGKTGIDVYSLFPIIKMKLFDVAMTEWGSINKYARRQDGTISSISGTDGIDDLAAFDKKLKEIQEMPPEKIPFTYVFSSVHYDNYSNSGGSNGPQNCYINFQFETPLIKKREPFWTSQSVSDNNCADPQLLERHHSFIAYHIKHVILAELYERKKDYLSGKQTEKIIKISFAVFESIPTIKNTPLISDPLLPYTYQALEILESIRIKTTMDTRLGRNSRQQMGLIAGTLIINGLNRSTDFNKVKEPTDLICKTDPNKIIENYSLFLTGFRYLTNAIMDSEFATKNGDNFKQFIELINSLPSELNDREKDNIMGAIEDYQDDLCVDLGHIINL